MIFENINQMIAITNDFYLVIFSNYIITLNRW